MKDHITGLYLGDYFRESLCTEQNVNFRTEFMIGWYDQKLLINFNR